MTYEAFMLICLTPTASGVAGLAMEAADYKKQLDEVRAALNMPALPQA